MKDIVVEGHRGYCAVFPENTMISYEAAMDLGVDAVEFDIRLTMMFLRYFSLRR